jgi:ABC-type multidrug transport system fused ATPase/permease subunit
MGVVYQWTFFLALGLLAIVITVFVFAVSLLGRALEAAVKSENEKLAERKENNAKEMASIKKEIEKAEAKGEIPKGLTRRLEQLEKKDKKFGRELAKIRRAPKLLTVKGGIIPPGVSLLVALILSGVAWYFWYLSTTQIFIWMVWIEPVFIWIVSLVAIGYSIFRIYQCLRVIESVAITSEQAALLKETEALKKVFRELEEERKPELQLKFEKQPPFHVKVNSETKLQFKVWLMKGDTAENVMVGFHFPPGFSFPRREFATQDADHPTIPNFVSARVDYNLPITRGAAILKDLVVKAPSKVGEFQAYYNLTCRGFCSEDKEFKIIVE